MTPLIGDGPTLPTKRQIAANRRNAGNSTGPRSPGGKKRARRNSLGHGLSAVDPSDANQSSYIERLARKIAGDTDDAIILEHARSAAQAEFDLAKIRRIKVALIERVRAFGQFGVPQPVFPPRVTWRFLEPMIAGNLPRPFDAASTMPITEPERTAEAMRRVLPELVKLDRYERRAAGRRDRALRAISRKYNL